MEVSGQLTPWPLHFWEKGPVYSFEWGLVSEPTCTLWRTGKSWFPCLELLLFCNSFCFRGPCYTCWPLWCTGRGSVSEQLPDLCNCCLLLCEMRHRLMFDLLIPRYSYYLTTLFQLQGLRGVVWQDACALRTGNDAVYCKVLSQHLPGDTGENWIPFTMLVSVSCWGLSHSAVT